MHRGFIPGYCRDGICVPAQVQKLMLCKGQAKGYMKELSKRAS